MNCCCCKKELSLVLLPSRAPAGDCRNRDCPSNQVPQLGLTTEDPQNDARWQRNQQMMARHDLIREEWRAGVIHPPLGAMRYIH